MDELYPPAIDLVIYEQNSSFWTSYFEIVPLILHVACDFG